MKVDKALSSELESARLTGRPVPVIVTIRNAEDVSSVLASGIKANITYQNMPGFSAELTADQIEHITAMPQVKLIELDTEANALRKP